MRLMYSQGASHDSYSRLSCVDRLVVGRALRSQDGPEH